MRSTRTLITVGCCLLALAVSAAAQSTRKPGLWEMTSTMTWQQSPMPPGMTMPAGANSPFGGGPRTNQVCVTQAMIDKYGGPYSNPPRGDCKMTDISVKPDGMTANIQCSGQITATGTVKSTYVDANTAKTSVHLAGTMQMGPNSRPVDMTMESTSTYKGADCGDVKPVAVPAGN